MRKHKQTRTQEKIIEVFEKSEELYKVIKEYLPFDMECPNDLCGGRNGVRQIASAWKTKNNKYNVFCYVCGQEAELSNKELKAKKRKFEKETDEYDVEEQYSIFEGE